MSTNKPVGLKPDLQTAIRDALAGSSSQKPVDVSRLYKLGDTASVQAALLEMYRSREVYCCRYIRKGNETSVWWMSGASSLPRFLYNKALKNALSQTGKARVNP